MYQDNRSLYGGLSKLEKVGRKMQHNIFRVLLILSFANRLIFSQWKVAGAQGSYLFNITRIDSSLYVGADQAIFISEGSGLNDWNKVSVDIRQVQRFLKHEEKIIAVANSGIYELNKETGYWEKINNGSLSAACLLILDDVWLAGITCDGVYRSTDNGKNWIYNANYDTDSLSCVSSLLQIDDKILAVTGNGLQVSYDRGLSWQKINTAISGEWLYNNTLLNIKDTIYAGGKGGLVKSKDRGNTWELLGLNYVTNIVNIGKRIFVTTMSAVYFSNDYGNNWIQIYSDGYEEGWSFQPFCLETYGENIFLATARGLYYMSLIEFDNPRMKVIYKDKIDLGPISKGKLKDTTIILENRGYNDLFVSDIVSNSSFLEVSPKTFTVHPGYIQTLNIRVLANNTGIIDATLIIKSNDLGGVKEIPIYANIKPLDFYLSQNYPNPFNPSTTIGYLTSGVNHVNLDVYNIIGEKVAIIVDEVKGPGKHKVIFDARNLSSGVYFYKISAGDYVDIKKMIFTK